MPAEDESYHSLASLSSLPDELLLPILAKLSLSELMQLRATSRRFRRFINNKMLLELGHPVVNYRRVVKHHSIGPIGSQILTMKVINEHQLTCGTEDGRILIWNLKYNMFQRSTQCGSPINAIARINERFLAIGSDSGTFRIWDLASSHSISKQKFISPISTIVLIKNNIIAIGFANGSLGFFNLNSGEYYTIQLGANPIWSLIPCCNTQLAAGCGDSTIHLVDYRTKEVRLTNYRSGPVMSLATIPEARLLISGTSFNRISVWNTETMEPVSSWKSLSPVWALATTKSGLIIAGTHDGNLSIWDWQTQTCLNAIQTGSGAVNAIAISPDETKIICACENGTIHIYTFASFPKSETADRVMLRSSL